MKEPYISLIIPVYNVSWYLRQCLDSVIGQTYNNLEIIIVDDGSTDDSGSICDDYAQVDNRILVFHTENHGLAAARNYGIDRATGEYLAFLDSDDWIDPGMFEKLVSYTKEYDPDVLAFKYAIEWKDHTEDIFLNLKDADKVAVYEGKEIVTDFILGERISNCSWNKLYRRSIFSDVRFPDGEVYEDIGCLFRIMDKAQKLVCIPEYLCHYRKRRNSIGDVYSAKNITDYWNAHYRRYRCLAEKYPELKDKLSENCIIAASRFWNCLYLSPAGERRGSEKTIEVIKDFLREHKKEIDALAKNSGMIKLLRAFRWNTSPLFLKALSILGEHRKKDERDKMFE